MERRNSLLFLPLFSRSLQRNTFPVSVPFQLSIINSFILSLAQLSSPPPCRPMTFPSFKNATVFQSSKLKFPCLCQNIMKPKNIFNHLPLCNHVPCCITKVQSRFKIEQAYLSPQVLPCVFAPGSRPKEQERHPLF